MSEHGPEKPTPRDYSPLFLAISLVLAANLFPFGIHKLPFLLLWLFIYRALRISIHQLLLIALISSALIMLQLFAGKLNFPSNRTYLSGLNSLFSVHKAVLGFLNRHYPESTSSTISIIAFNSKSPELYQSFKNLGIPHLISVSGLHFGIAFKLLSKIFRSQRIIFLILLAYGTSIDYSIPGLRALLAMTFGFQKDALHRGSLTVLFALPFNLMIYRSMSFMLSYGFSLIFAINRQLFRRRLALGIANYVFAFFVSTMSFLPFSPHTIHLMAIPNAFILTPVVIFMFVGFLIGGGCVYLSPVHSTLSSGFGELIQKIQSTTLNLNLEYGDWGFSGLGFLLFGLFMLMLWRRYR